MIAIKAATVRYVVILLTLLSALVKITASYIMVLPIRSDLAINVR